MSCWTETDCERDRMRRFLAAFSVSFLSANSNRAKSASELDGRATSPGPDMCAVYSPARCIVKVKLPPPYSLHSSGCTFGDRSEESLKKVRACEQVDEHAEKFCSQSSEFDSCYRLLAFAPAPREGPMADESTGAVSELLCRDISCHQPVSCHRGDFICVPGIVAQRWIHQAQGSSCWTRE